MDKAAKTFAEKIVNQLGHILDALRSNRPRKNNPPPVSDANNTSQKNQGADGQPAIVSHIYPTPNTTYSTQQKWYQSFQGWKSALEIIGIIFAIGYAIVTYLQWRDVTNNFKVDERAWVGPSGMVTSTNSDGTKRDKFLKEGDTGIFGINIRNTGKTIARNFKALVMVKVYGAKETFIPVFDPLQRPSVSVIQPGEQAILYTSASDRLVNKSDVDKFTTGTQILYVYGSLAYNDIFREPHSTTFCLFLTRDLKNFNSCGFYNDAN